MKLLARGVKGFAHRRSCFRLKRALCYEGINWHGRCPQPSTPQGPYHKLDTR